MMVLYALIGLLFVWLVVVSFFLFKTKKHYQSLISRTRKQTLDGILDTLVDSMQRHDKKLESIDETIDEVKKHAENHFQKMAVVRFNPFDRMVGDQSFVIALLDKQDNGVILNFMYTREGVRVYPKQIEGGKALEYDLSEEEKKAIHEAK